LDGLLKSSNERVFLLAASNLPWELDMALLRRLEKRILVPLPSKEAREDMLKSLIPPSISSSIDYDSFAERLEVS
jgi:katanin p60 ATPase-containing subunit A1